MKSCRVKNKKTSQSIVGRSSLLNLFFLDFGQQVFSQHDNRPISSANVLQDDFVGGLVGDLESSLVPELVPPLLLQKVQRFIQQ